MALKPAVTRGIEEITARFAGHAVHIREDGAGGAYVIIDEVELGPLYIQPTTWMGSHLDFNYPYSDTYPHFVRGNLARVDGRGLGDGAQPTTWEERPAIQLSRRSNHLDATIDRADLKFLKVLDWLQHHP